MLRNEARRTHRKVVDLAEAVIVGPPMLPARSIRGSGEHAQDGPFDTDVDLPNRSLCGTLWHLAPPFGGSPSRDGKFTEVPA
jgi:hypothetical protein